MLPSKFRTHPKGGELAPETAVVLVRYVTLSTVKVAAGIPNFIRK